MLDFGNRSIRHPSHFNISSGGGEKRVAANILGWIHGAGSALLLGMLCVRCLPSRVSAADYSPMVQELIGRAESGIVAAQVERGAMFRAGRGVPKARAEAVRLWDEQYISPRAVRDRQRGTGKVRELAGWGTNRNAKIVVDRRARGKSIVNKTKKLALSGA